MSDENIDLSRTAANLLAAIARHDMGEGVVFEPAPRNRWRLNGHTYNGSTFYPLERAGLIDVGNGTSDPVLITAAGLSHLAARTAGKERADQ